MKNTYRILYCFCLFLFVNIICVYTLSAQNRIEFNDYTLVVTTNTIQGVGKAKSTISISINGDLTIPDSLQIRLQNRPNIYLAYTSGNQETILAETSLRARQKGFQLRFEATDQQFIDKLINPKNVLYLVSAADIVFDVRDGGVVTQNYLYSISTDALKRKSILAELSITDEQREELIDARGGYQSIYFNKLDTGWRQAEADTASNDAYIDFSFAKPLNDVFSIGIGGLLSTEIDDQFAHLELTPFILTSKDRSYSLSGTYQTSLNSDSQRFLVRGSYRGIADNFIDLTQGYKRLRVKPLINAGIGAMYFTKTPDASLEETLILEPFVQLLYNIPVLDKYLVKLDFFAFTRTDKDLVLDLKNATKWQANIDIGYDVGETTKVVGKYSYGTFGLTNETNQQLMLGLLVDIFNQ